MSRRHDNRLMGRKERDLQRIYKLLFGRHDWATPYAFHALRGRAPHVWMSNYRMRKSVLLAGDDARKVASKAYKEAFTNRKRSP